MKMKCITFGQLILIIIVLMFIGANLDLPILGSGINSLLVMWWIAGFFINDCEFFGEKKAEGGDEYESEFLE